MLGGITWTERERMKGCGSLETDCGDLFTCGDDSEGSVVPRGGVIPPGPRLKSYSSSSSSRKFSSQGVKGPAPPSLVREGHCMGIILEIGGDDGAEFSLVIAID